MSSNSSCKSYWKNFGFVEATADQFTRIQWSQNKWVFFCYRLFVLCYVVGFFIAGYITSLEQNFYELLSYWTEIVMVLYSLVSFLVSIHGICQKSNFSSSKEENLRWFHILTWILFDVVTTASLMVLLLFWITVAPTRPAAENTNPITLHLHLIIHLLQLIDIFMIAFPVRLLHFIYPGIYGLIYSIFLVILHVTGVNPSVYDVINFETNAGLAVGILVGIVFAAVPLLHGAYVFALNSLSRFLATKTVQKEQSEKPKTGK